MNNNLHPCIWFNGNALEAATFYTELFPASRITAETPVVVNFELSGQPFMGLNGGPVFSPNPSISLFVTSESAAEIETLYRQLSHDGVVMMPLGKYDWSAYYAFIQDKYGVAWQLFTGNYSEVNQKITACLLFTGKRFGQAEAAIQLYTKVFSPSAISGILKYTAEEGTEVAGKVKHAQFSLDNTVMMAMDGAGDHAFDFSEGVSFVVECKDQGEIDYYWNHLVENGGAESMCGWLKDPFGVSWQIIPADIGTLLNDPEKGSGAMNALMQMRKIIIADLHP